MSTCVLLLAVVLVTAAVPAAGQEQPTAEFEGLVEVSEVLLDVLATDRKGNVVRGLGEEDFLVEQDGKPVELTGVSFYATRYGEAETGDGTAGAAGAGAPEVPSSRYFVFFFHDQAFSSGSLAKLRRRQLEAGRAAHDWVRDAMYPSDWAAVVGHRGRLFVFQDFTQDRETLVAAIGDAARSRRPEEPKLSEWKRLAAATPLALRRGLPPPAELRKKSRRMYDAIRLVAQAVRPIVGRKNLLLFTLGFGDLDPFSLQSLPDLRFYPAMEQALNHANVAVYPIDLAHPHVTHTQESFLRRLALGSGGFYYRNLTSFATRLEKIAAEASGYYLLSFRATHPAGESGYRQVTVRSARREVRLRARRGYRYGT